MNGWQRRFVAAVALAGMAFAGRAYAQGPELGGDYSTEDWPFVGGDQSSSRYSRLTDISTDTIDRLGGVWVTRLDGGGSSRSTPVVKDGVLYLTAGASVLAIDGAGGME